MAFSNRRTPSSKGYSKGPSPSAKKVLPRTQLPKNMQVYRQQKDVLRGAEPDLARMPRKKAPAVFPKSEIKDTDIDQELNFTEALSNENDCVWLSSDSTSLLSFDDSQDWELDFLDIALCEQFSSALSVSGSSGVFMNGKSVVLIDDGLARIDPTDEAALVLDRPSEGTERSHLQDKVVVWLHNTDANKVADLSLGCLESGDSSCETSLCEQSSLFDSSNTSLSTYDDTSSYAHDFDSTDLLASLLDLEGEDSELVQDKDHMFDVLSSGFPSPPISARLNVSVRSSHSSSIANCGWTEEMKSLSEETVADEPLFWPFDLNSYWHPEFDMKLCISPSDTRRNLGILEPNELKPSRLRLNQKQNHPEVGKNMRGGCRRKIIFSSASNLADADCGSICLDNKAVEKIITTPSRSTGLTLDPEHNASKNSMKQKHFQSEARRSEHQSNLELCSKLLIELEASNIRDLVNERTPIEKMVGLREFDGNEGMNVEFSGDPFTIQGPP